MRGRRDLWQTEREKAEVLPCGLKVLRGEHTRAGKSGPTATIFAPKGIKPIANLIFRDEARREAYIAEQVANLLDKQRRVADRKAIRSGLGGVKLEEVNVGDIFDYSWGYDQTNVEFLQVVERRGRRVVVRELAQEQVNGSQGFMSASVLPIKDKFLEPNRFGKGHIASTKLIQWTDDGRAYLAMPYGWCDLWKGSPQHSSWYA